MRGCSTRATVSASCCDAWLLNEISEDRIAEILSEARAGRVREIQIPAQNSPVVSPAVTVNTRQDRTRTVHGRALPTPRPPRCSPSTRANQTTTPNAPNGQVPHTFRDSEIPRRPLARDRCWCRCCVSPRTPQTNRSPTRHGRKTCLWATNVCMTTRGRSGPGCADHSVRHRTGRADRSSETWRLP
jgi:hypothetical protein